MNNPEIPQAPSVGQGQGNYAPVQQIHNPAAKLQEIVGIGIIFVVFCIGYWLGNNTGYSNGQRDGRKEGHEQGYQQARQDIAAYMQKQFQDFGNAIRQSPPQQPQNPPSP